MDNPASGKLGVRFGNVKAWLSGRAFFVNEVLKHDSYQDVAKARPIGRSDQVKQRPKSLASSCAQGEGHPVRTRLGSVTAVNRSTCVNLNLKDLVAA